MRLALFDFDCTITTHDSFREFLIFSFGYRALFLASLRLFPWLLAYLLGIVKNDICKQKFVRHYFKGMTTEQFDALAIKFVKKKLNHMINPRALKRMLWHLQNNDKIVVVSASFEEYLSHWCSQHQVELIGTKLGSDSGSLTGNIDGKNCWGIEKVNRIKQKYNLEDYSCIFAYGDSRGDKEMLEIAHEKHFRSFK